MTEVATIKFKHACDVEDYITNFKLMRGDQVIVELEKSTGIGTVLAVKETDKDTSHLRRIIRHATESDINKFDKIEEKEKIAFQFCFSKIKERNLPMRLISVDFLQNASKATFYFTSDGRIDFRALVKDLAKEFHTRIQMKQIGVRDETSIVGGIGPCGKEFCCSTFLANFLPVTIKYAKEQMIALNPSKISGTCGRLMCCLAYEYSVYTEYGRDMPRPQTIINSCFGECKVKNINILKQKLFVEFPDGTEKNIDKVKKAGADFICETQAIFEGNPKENLERLRRMF